MHGTEKHQLRGGVNALILNSGMVDGWPTGELYTAIPHSSTPSRPPAGKTGTDHVSPAEGIPDDPESVRHADDYRLEYNTIHRPHGALAWNRPADVHTGRSEPLVIMFPKPGNMPVT